MGKIANVKATIRLSSDAQPKSFKSRTLPYALVSKVESELNRLQREGVIVPVQHSNWAAPIVPVLKPDGSVRICGDYKLTVNRYSILDRYPLPRIEDLYATLAGGQKFTKIDLSHAYSQVELDSKSQDCTTIATHVGLFQYTRLPFGINSAPAIFQRIIDNMVKDVPNTCAYLDDILITGRSEEEHLRTLQIIFKRLKDNGFNLKRAKCEFFRNSVSYLGYKLDTHGLHVLDEKIRPIIQAPEPVNEAELRSFIGVLSHYRRFLPNISTTLSPLYALLYKGAKWNWDVEQRNAFKIAEEKLANSSLLVHFDQFKPIVLHCDASSSGLGASLGHKMNDGSIRPIAFASRTLLPAEKNYSQIDKEALAVIFGIKRFHQYIWGRRFDIFTDHKPLLSLLGENKGIEQMCSPRMQRWALILSAYTYNIQYLPGVQNSTADALSRLPLKSDATTIEEPPELVHMMQHFNSAPICGKELRRLTDKDPIMSAVKSYLLTNWPEKCDDKFKAFFNRRNELSLHEGCIFWGPRIVIPSSARKQILHELHDAHTGATRMKAHARSYCWWPNLDADLEDIARMCELCQKYQRHHPPGPIHPWRWPERPWQRVHADYFGPICGSMFLLLIDAHSKWIDVHMVNHATAETTVSKMRTSFCTFGLPDTVCTDNGTPFTSDLFQTFLRNNGVEHVRTAPYHPSSNGLAERAVQTVKNGLAKQTSGTLQTKLDRFLFSYRAIPLESTGKSPAEMMFGRNLRTRLQLMFPSTRSRIEARQECMTDPHKIERSYCDSDPVFTRLPNESQWQPATIVSTSGNLANLQLPNGNITRRHLDHVRPRVIRSTESLDQRDIAISSGADTTTTETLAGETTNPRRSQRATPPVDRYQVETYSISQEKEECHDCM